MLRRGRASKRRCVGIALLAALVFSLGGSPGTAAATESEPPFCISHVLHDYLTPLKRMPELRELPFRRRAEPLFHGVRIGAAGPPLAINGGRAGYQLQWDANPKWDVTVTLARMSRRGEAVGRIRQRHLRLGELAPALITEPSFALSGNPAVYRTTLLIRSRSGRKLAEFGNYYRVVRPSVHGRLALSAPAYAPGGTVFARIENPGAAFILFGEEYAIERLEGEAWVRAPESGGPFVMPLYNVAPGRTSGHCTVFPIPSAMPLGRYRLSQEVIFSWPLQSRSRELRPTLHAEFDVAVFETQLLGERAPQ